MKIFEFENLLKIEIFNKYNKSIGTNEEISFLIDSKGVIEYYRKIKNGNRAKFYKDEFFRISLFEDYFKVLFCENKEERLSYKNELKEILKRFFNVFLNHGDIDLIVNKTIEFLENRLVYPKSVLEMSFNEIESLKANKTYNGVYRISLYNVLNECEFILGYLDLENNSFRFPNKRVGVEVYSTRGVANLLKNSEIDGYVLYCFIDLIKRIDNEIH